MGCKRKVVETASHTTKQTVQDLRKRKAKMKKKANKFILDQQGDSKPTAFLNANKTKADNTLGHDPLIQKERYVMSFDGLHCQHETY